MTTVLMLWGLGFFSGTIGALMGLGGGIFLVPLLTFALGLPIRTAIGASLVAVVATSAGVGAFSPHGRGADVGLALRLEITTAAGAIAGGFLAGMMNEEFLTILFSLVVFFTAGYTHFKGGVHSAGSGEEKLFRQDYRVRHWNWGISGSTVAGMLSGMLGVGGGFIKVPVMYAVMEVPLGVATATSNLMVGMTAAASMFVYYARGDVYPLIAVPSSLGIFMGAMLAMYITPHLRADWLRKALIALLFLIGVYMLLKALLH
jgi:uncharacterized membrane protein YfcA